MLTRPDLLILLPTLLPLLLWIAVGIYPAFYLATLLHEIGHAVAGCLPGFAVTSFGMGTASPLLSVTVPGTATRFYICRRNALQGVTWFLQTDHFPSRRRYTLLILSGALANTLGFGVLFLLWRLTGWLPLLLLAVPNAVLATLALVPYSYALPGTGVRMYSDGALALARLLGRAHRRVYSPRLLLGMASLWEAVGDRPMLGFQSLAAALYAAEIGDETGARQYREAAPDALASLPSSGPLRSFLVPYTHLIDGQIHAYAERWEAATVSLRAAEASFAANGYRSAVRLTEIFRHAAAPQEAEALRAAETALARIAGDPDHLQMSRRHPALALATYENWLLVHLRALLHAHAALLPPPLERLETLLARYEAAARHSRDHLADLRVYATLARYRRETGDTEGAAVAERRARDAAKAVEAALAAGADPDALRAFQARTQALLRVTPLPTPSLPLSG